MKTKLPNAFWRTLSALTSSRPPLSGTSTSQPLAGTSWVERGIWVVLLVMIMGQLAQAQWTQLGSSLPGAVNGNLAGSSVAVSGDGQTMAFGAAGTSPQQGQVKVYSLGSVGLTQLGNTIPGSANGDQTGKAVALSNDGRTVAVGAPAFGSNNGQVKVYTYNGTTWTQLGSTISGTGGESAGASVALSSDGLTLAVGAPLNNGPFPAFLRGQVRVYKLISGAWTLQGSVINGDAFDGIGFSVAISDDGLTVAEGAPLTANLGKVKVYTYSGTNWTQKGITITGDAANGAFGWSVVLSSSGQTLAVGAPNANSVTGQVKVYTYTGTWNQQGSTITGVKVNDGAGWSVALSDDGLTAAVGAPGYGAFPGQTRVYKFESGVWTQKGSSISGDGNSDLFGYSVSLSGDGQTLAIGATNDSSNKGKVKVFRFCALSVSILPTSPAICAGSPVSLTATGSGGDNYSYSWSNGQNVATLTASPANTTAFSVTVTSGVCSATASQLVTVKELPQTPTLVTASGYPYPAGVSSLTLSQNVGPVTLTASGCSGGMLMANGNAASSLTITTAMTGTQTYTATCTSNGCTSPAASFQLTVVPTTLSVLHRDADYGNTGNNIIKPFLELANADGQAIPYGDLTVRYWFTSEGNAPPTNLAVYYAQLGAVNMQYVALTQPRQGALGYIEYSFPGGGSLGGGGNSGPIENGIQKTDGSNFDESDDYSYQANYQDYLANAHVTAYRNGADGVPVIVWGQEPTMVASQTAIQVYSQAKDGTTTSQIQTRVELRNTGNVALPVANLKLRYYFTSDNGQLANVYVDYADMGASNVAASVVKLASPVGGADSYVELAFPGNPMQLNALSSLGAIDFRLVRSDYGLFDQTNDYSYAANYGNVGLNDHITAYVNNSLVFGTPPSGAPARLGVAEESTPTLQVRVLGNPVVGSHAAVEISGAYVQPVQLRLVDLQGRTVHEQRIEQAGSLERVLVPVGSGQGLLLLKVSTATQQQQIKLLRP